MITIYRLYNKDGKCYIGSTRKNPWRRFLEHKTNYKAGNRAISSYDLFDVSSRVDMEPLEICSEEDRMSYEKYWIGQFKETVMNRYTMDIDYSDYQKKYQKKYKKRLTQKLECSCGSWVSRKNIATHKKRAIHKKKFDSKKKLIKI